MAVIAMWPVGLVNRPGLTGTGLAQPKRGPFASASIAGSRIEPNGSICGIGLSVRRPALRAVGSPSLPATKPCETSCTMIDGIRMRMTRPASMKSLVVNENKNYAERRVLQSTQYNENGRASMRAAPISLPHDRQVP